MRDQRRILALTVLLGLCVSLAGLANAGWIHWYDHEGEVRVGTVLMMEDELWLVGTSITSQDPLDEGIVVFRVQPDGTLNYAMSYDWDGVQGAADAVITAEDRIFFAGRTDTYGAVGSDMYVLQTDLSGQTLSEWVIGDMLEESVTRIVLGSQGDYFIVGNQMNPSFVVAGAETPGYAGPEFNTSPYVARIAADGTTVWKKDYATLSNRVVFDAVPTSTGGCFLLCTVYDVPNADAIQLNRLTDTGGTMWQRNFAEGRSEGYALHGLDGGWLLIAGSRTPADSASLQALLMMVSATGSEVWSRTFGEPDQFSSLHTVIETRDGLFVAAGKQYAEDAEYQDSVYLVCVDMNGELQWEQTVPTGAHVTVDALIELPDGGLLVAGSGAAADGPSRAMLIRVDPPVQDKTE